MIILKKNKPNLSRKFGFHERKFGMPVFLFRIFLHTTELKIKVLKIKY